MAYPVKRFKKRFKRKWALLRLLTISNGTKRAEYIKKKKLLGAVGNDCWWEPRRLPSEPELVFLGNNVKVATEVAFMNHDLTMHVLNKKCGSDKYKFRKGEIHVGDNVFIGGRTTVLYDVSIGSNVIIGACSLINKDVPDNSVVAGCPAKYIKSFEEYEKSMPLKQR